MDKELKSNQPDQSAFGFVDEIKSENGSLRVGVIGASGLVGDKLISILHERSFPVGELHLFSSSTSAGHWMDTHYGTLPLMELNPKKPPELDVVFMAAGASVSKQWGWKLARRGAYVIDKSSYFRDKTYAPLVVPEVNPGELAETTKIIATPNCTTIPLVMAVSPLHDRFELRKITVSTYQSVSGAGKVGIETLEREIAFANDHEKVFPQRIAHNVLPWIGGGEKGFNEEEIKIKNETRRILRNSRLPVRATAVRVPTKIGHAVAVHADFHRKISVSEAEDLIRSSSGVTLIDAEDRKNFPTPLNCEGKDDVFVGRLRSDRGRRGLAFWVVSDNLRKGAALNAVQIAEKLIELKFLCQDD